MNASIPNLTSFRSWIRVHPALSIMVIALMARCAFATFLVSTHGEQGFSFPIFSDIQNYDTIARNLLAGNGYSRETEPPYLPDTKRTPLYPFFLAIGYFLGGGSRFVAIFLQIFIAAATAGIAVRLGEELWSRRAGVIAGFLVAVQPFGVFLSTQLLTETLYTFLFAGGMYLVLRRSAEMSWWNSSAAGAVLGAAALTRPIGEYVPWLIIPALFIRFSPRRAMRAALLMLLGFALVISPWMYRNYRVAGIPTLSYEANILFDLHYGAYRSFKETGSTTRFGDYRLATPASALIQTPRVEFVRRLAQTIIADPFGFGGYFVTTLVPFIFGDGAVTMFASLVPAAAIPAWTFSWNASALGASLGFGASSPGIAILLVFGKLVWALLWIFAIRGGARAWASGGATRAFALCALLLVLYFAVPGGPVNSARYRLPVEPLILVAAGIGFCSRQKAVENV